MSINNRDVAFTKKWENLLSEYRQKQSGPDFPFDYLG